MLFRSEERVLLERAPQAATCKIVGPDIGDVVGGQVCPALMTDRIGHGGKATAFARAVGTDDAEDFARADGPADIAQRDQRAVLHRQVFNPQHISAVVAMRFL